MSQVIDRSSCTDNDKESENNKVKAKSKSQSRSECEEDVTVFRAQSTRKANTKKRVRIGRRNKTSVKSKKAEKKISKGGSKKGLQEDTSWIVPTEQDGGWMGRREQDGIIHGGGQCISITETWESATDDESETISETRLYEGRKTEMADGWEGRGECASKRRKSNEYTNDRGRYNEFRKSVNRTEGSIIRTKERIRETERKLARTETEISETRRGINKTKKKLADATEKHEEREEIKREQELDTQLCEYRQQKDGASDYTVNAELMNDLRKERKESLIEQSLTGHRHTACARLRPEQSSYRRPKMKISVNSDYRPLETRRYFSVPKGVRLTENKKGLATVIPFFNEPSYELQQTLNSLYDSWNYLKKNSKKWRNEELYIFIVQDGWHNADETMKEYLKALYPKKKKGRTWDEYYKEFTEYEFERDGTRTYIFEGEEAININPQKKVEDKYMNVTMMVKMNNRRKHNSHEWYIGKNGFAEAVNAKYLFMTDAFTLFNESCLYHIVRQMDEDKGLSAVTGRQRVMTREQQGNYESMFSFGYILRMIQLYDFELSNAVYNGAFALTGILPVVPGPCGLYRASDVLQDAVREWYFEVINSDPDTTGLVLGNLRIAEDRLLSYAAAIKTETERKIGFNPLAVFYFEAETSLRNFILQRRRWINGSVAGYIYLLFTGFKHFREWKISPIRKVSIWLLLFFQFLIYLMVAISPGITMRMCYYGIEHLLEANGANNLIILIVVMGILWAAYIVHVFVHHWKKFNSVVIYALVLISFCTSVASFGSIIYYIVNDKRTIWENITRGGVPVYLGIFVAVCPFILSLLLSGRGHSTLLMMKSFLAYLLFMPLMIAWFGSYAYARIWDLSWGNRPASELSDMRDEKKNRIIKKYKDASRKVILALIVANIVIFVIPLQGQLVIMSTFFVMASIQMILSLIYMLIRIKHKLQYCTKRCKRRNDKTELESIVSL